MQASTTQDGVLFHQATRLSGKRAEWRRRNARPEANRAAGRREAGHKKHAAKTGAPQDSKTTRNRAASCVQEQTMSAAATGRRETPQTNSISRTHQEHRPEASRRRAAHLRRPPAVRMLTTSAAFLLAALIVTCYALVASEQSQAYTPQANRPADLSSRPVAATTKSAHLSSSATAIEQAEATAASKSKSTGHEEASSRLDEVVVSRSYLQGVARRSKRASPSRTGATAAGQRQTAAAAAQNQRPREDWQPAAGRGAGANVKNVTAQNGQAVMLHCFVEPNEAGEIPPVSWLRGSGELQLISLDATTVMADGERFVIRHGLERENDWALQISALNKSTDAGLYRCQTSDESATQLQEYQLNIVEPQASILGSPDLAVRVGAPINLTCVISHSPDQLQFVFWYRDERMINYDFEREKRGKIVLSKVAARPDTIASTLQLFRATPDDSANYTCAPSGAKSTSIHVHVLQAADKRLIMFQNDDNQQRELFAASSQQSNSALSGQPARLSRARAYALLAALLILAAWFQLVAQVQTCISLCLLAVIGLLLGRTNCAPNTDRRHRRQQDSKSTASDELKFRRLSSGSCEPPADCSDERLTPGSPCASSEGKREFALGQTAADGSLEADPLLSGAHSALHLLRALTRNSDSTCSLASSRAGCDEASQGERRRQRAPAASAQTSPSGASSASTGYNSDSARPLPPANVNLAPDEHSRQRHKSHEDEDEELEMIELLRNQPSAMRLIMEQLRAAKINQPAGELRPLGKQLICSGSAGSFGRSAERKNNNSHAANSLERVLQSGSSCLNTRGRFFEPDFCQFAERGHFAHGPKSAGSGGSEQAQEEPIYSIPASRAASGAPSVSGEDCARGEPTDVVQEDSGS